MEVILLPPDQVTGTCAGEGVILELLSLLEIGDVKCLGSRVWQFRETAAPVRLHCLAQCKGDQGTDLKDIGYWLAAANKSTFRGW